METTELTMKFPGLAGALRLFSAARALLALVGLAVILAATLPAPREALLRQFAAWTEAWEAPAMPAGPSGIGPSIEPAIGAAPEWPS